MKKIEIETIVLTPDKNAKKLRPGWKSWFCSKCGDGWLYLGKRPKHKCSGKFTFMNLMSKESEQELINCIAEKIKKEII